MSIFPPLAYFYEAREALEVLVLLFMLKLRYPNGVVLLLGVHETRSFLQSMMGIHEKCQKLYGNKCGEEVFAALTDTTDHLPLAAVIDTKARLLSQYSFIVDERPYRFIAHTRESILSCHQSQSSAR